MAARFRPQDLVFFDIIQCALDWALPRETLERAPIGSYQASVQIDGPRRLAQGESATYRCRYVNPEGGPRPATGHIWSPAIQETSSGLCATAIAFDSITVRAEDGSGKGVITVRRDWAHGTDNGRLEIELVAGR